MNPSSNAVQATPKTVQCPYCNRDTTIEMPQDYAPVYVHCDSCSKKFVVEQYAESVRVLTTSQACYSSDPDCNEIEMGSSDEQ